MMCLTVLLPLSNVPVQQSPSPHILFSSVFPSFFPSPRCGRRRRNSGVKEVDSDGCFSIKLMPQATTSVGLWVGCPWPQLSKAWETQHYCNIWLSLSPHPIHTVRSSYVWVGGMIDHDKRKDILYRMLDLYVLGIVVAAYPHPLDLHFPNWNCQFLFSVSAVAPSDIDVDQPCQRTRAHTHTPEGSGYLTES